MGLNMDLVRRQGVSKRDVKKLNMLHELMSDLVDQQNWYHEHIGLKKKDVKKLRKVVRQMEFTMQMVWGFDEDKSLHYHWSRFDALAEQSSNETV
jgi:hypothetical protein